MPRALLLAFPPSSPCMPETLLPSLHNLPMPEILNVDCGKIFSRDESFPYPTTDLGYKVGGPRLRELAPAAAARGRQEAGFT